MAEPGGGTDNKVVIEFDLETRNFQVKLGQVNGMLGTLPKAGVLGFQAVSLAVMAFNQALELVEKSFKAINASIDAIEAADKVRNQTIAIKNLALSVGLNSDVLVKAVKDAAGGALSTADAARVAFQALNSGIEAKTIPALVKLADQFSSSGRVAKSTAEIIKDFTWAIETGTTKGLKEYGIAQGIAGDRATVLQAILGSGTKEVSKYGTEFNKTGERMRAKWDDFTSSMSKTWGKFLGTVLESKTPLQETTEQISKLEKELKAVKAVSGAGWDYLKMTNAYSGYKTQAQIVSEIETKLAEQREKLAQITAKNAKNQAEMTAELEKGGKVEKELTQEEAKRIELAAQVITARRAIAKEEEQSGSASIRSIEEYKRARKQQIDREAEDERELARSRARTRQELMGELISIEERRRQKQEQIAMSEQVTKQAQQEGEKMYLEQHLADEEGAYERLKEMQIARENDEHQRKLASMALKKQDETSYRAEVEAEEQAHQERLKGIRDQYNAVNTKNFRAGVNMALADMNRQYGSFSTIVQRSMVKTQNIMTNSFVAAAKGHGDAMELMKQQFLEMIGTEMIQSGTFHVLKGIATMNPAEIGAGSALIAAGMAIVSASATGAPAAGGEGGGGYSSAPYASEPVMPTQEQMERKTAQIIIQGDYLNSRETANHLAEVLRTNSDVTDYAIVAQGRNYA